MWQSRYHPEVVHVVQNIKTDLIHVNLLIVDELDCHQALVGEVFSMSNQVQVPALAAAKALEWVPRQGVVGLGTGRAAVAFVTALAQRMREQTYQIQGVATSQATAELAERLGIPLIDLDDVEAIDVTVDGADEVDPSGTVIKGFGGALLREKVVARLSRKWVLIVGRDKLVRQLGERGRLPVEVVKFAAGSCIRQIRKLGFESRHRLTDGVPFVTDNQNYILDCLIKPGDDVISLAESIRAIPGVVDTGLFAKMIPTVLVQDG